MKFYLVIILLIIQTCVVIASDDLATITGGLNLGDSLVSTLNRKPKLTTLLGEKPKPESDQTTLFEQIGPNDFGINAVTYIFKKGSLASLILNHPITNEKRASEAYGTLFKIANLSGLGSAERTVDEQSITIRFRHKTGEAWITVPFSIGITSANATLQLLHKNEVDYARKVIRDHLPQKPQDFDRRTMDFLNRLNQTNNANIQFSPQIGSQSERQPEYRQSTNATASTALGSAFAMHVGTLTLVAGFLFIIFLVAIWLLLKRRS